MNNKKTIKKAIKSIDKIIATLDGSQEGVAIKAKKLEKTISILLTAKAELRLRSLDKNKVMTAYRPAITSISIHNL